MALTVGTTGTANGGTIYKPPPKPPAPVYYPTPPKTTYTAPKTTSTATTSRTSSGTTSRTSSGSTSDPYARARADQLADQRKAESKAAARLSAQAKRLGEQAVALKLALGADGFRATLLRELKNADLEFNEEDSLILAQYGRGKASLEQAASTTEDQKSRSLQEAINNAGRERNEALQEGIANGVGAFDMLKAQAASLRNWSFNMGQVQANYTDEINGLQSEHAQMVNSVVTSRQSAWREREQQRAQLYRGYYDNRGQVLTEIGNKLGEASQYYDMANEQVESKTYSTAAKNSSTQALNNLRAAAAETGKSYTERATPSSILDWQGSAKIDNTNDPRRWGQPVLEMKDAEGATLRKWEQ